MRKHGKVPSNNCFCRMIIQQDNELFIYILCLRIMYKKKRQNHWAVMVDKPCVNPVLL